MPGKPSKKISVSDEKAERLEQAGLWHRAATRWLEVFDNNASNSERDWIRARRNMCIRKTHRPFIPMGNFKDVRQAADTTLKRMELD